MLASGMSKLAQVLSERIGEQTKRPDALELGTIQGNMSLLIDRFPIPIPWGEYLVCRSLTQLSPLKAGDRVLVAWVNDGTDPVVIDVVVSS